MFKRNVGFRSQVYTPQFNRHRQTAETLPLLTFDYTYKRRKGSVVGGTMASAEHEPITGVWGQNPQRGPGAEPVVRRSGGRSLPEAESIFAQLANLASFQKCPFELRYTQQSP